VQPTHATDSPAMTAMIASDPQFISDSFWPDGMIRVSGREYNGLIESPCFKNATSPERALSCLSCHSLHKADADPRTLGEWADDQLVVIRSGNSAHGGAAPASDNGACLQCHQPLAANLPAHTHHDAKSAGSLCYNCHMPYTTYGLLKTIRSHTVGIPTVRESVETGRPNACNLCHLDRTLTWTADALRRWYNTPEVALGSDEQSTAASLLWLLKGDAGQRAIVAQAMAWPPAQEVAGTEWMAPYLAQLLEDPYDAVRFTAIRSLKSLPGFAAAPLEVVATPGARRQSQLQVMSTWDRIRPRPARTSPELLMTPNGDVDIPRVLAMLRQRNNRLMLLRE